MKKKALAVLYSPKTLVDFIWYYFTFGKSYEWDVLCLPCGKEGLTVAQYCIEAGIFRNIYTTDISIEKLSKKEMVLIAVKMTVFWSLRKSKQFARDYLEKIVDGLDYDLHVVPCDNSFLCGLLVSLSSEVETVILEDGLGDCLESSSKFLPEFGLNLLNISSFACSIMGYGAGASLAHYINKPSCLCTKYVVHPEWMSYKDYKEIRQLGDLKNTDIKSWRDCLYRTFKIDKDMKFEGDVILFSDPWDGSSDIVLQKVANMTVHHILTKYNPQKVLLKKHHRDTADYNFPKEIEVVEIEKSIPGELLLNMVQCKKHIFMQPSTLLVSYKDYSNCEVLKFKELIEDCSFYNRIYDANKKKLKLSDKYISLI